MQTCLSFFTIAYTSGEDRAAFMHGQLPNGINRLAKGSICYATCNIPKGCMLANMLVLNCGSDLLLVMAANLTKAIVKHLCMFVLRAKVVFESLPDYAVVTALDENTEAHAAAKPSLSFPAAEENDVWTVSLPHTGRLEVGEAERLPEHDVAAENAWNLREICSGYTWISAATKETVVVQTLSQHIIGGVHSREGCYPGQETIARVQYRGQAKHDLAVLSSDSLEVAGITVLENGAGAGQIINTVLTDTGSLSLAVIKCVAAQAVPADTDGNNLKQGELFFNIEPKG